MPGGSVSVTPTTGTPLVLRERDEPLDGGLARLGIVDQRSHLAALEIVLEGRDVGRRRLGAVHHREREFLLAHVEPQGFGRVAEHRLGRGDGCALDTCFACAANVSSSGRIEATNAASPAA